MQQQQVHHYCSINWQLLQMNVVLKTSAFHRKKSKVNKASLLLLALSISTNYKKISRKKRFHFSNDLEIVSNYLRSSNNYDLCYR